MVLPDRCSVRQNGKDCINPPEFVISVKTDKDEYMVGVTCTKHKDAVLEKLSMLQNEEKIPKGKIQFSGLKSVGTDCIRADPDELIQL